MSRSRRLLAIGACLAVVAVIAVARLQGEPGLKSHDLSVKAGPVVRPVGTAQGHAEREIPASRFEAGGVITYQTVKGENLFALQLKPELPAVPARKRDYLILVCNDAAQAGEPGIAAMQIADAIVQTAGPDDRIALWIVSTPDHTKPLFKGFLYAKDDRKKLDKAIVDLKNRPFPAGVTDLKHAFDQAIGTFDGSESRQRIVLYLGNGQSLGNPMDSSDRQALIQKMVKNRIAFFSVPLGLHFNADTLHGLATGTGGVVLRTKVAEEKLPDALKRYQQALAGAVLYDAEIKMPANVTEFVPKVLPPLRADVPTLVVGRLKEGAALTYQLSGNVAGRSGQFSLAKTEKVPAPELDNYVLVSMLNQWLTAPSQAAFIRADRALALAYENTRLFREDKLLSAQIALEKDQVAAALRLYEEARAVAPHDPEAAAGIKICTNLKAGKLSREVLKEQMRKAARGALKVENVGGTVRLKETDLARLAQLEKNEVQPGPKEAVPAPGPGDREDLLQAHRTGMLIEGQKMTQAVDNALAQARNELPRDPDGTIEFLKNTLLRIKDHPDLSDDVRNNLVSRLETYLVQAATQGRTIKLQKQERIAIAAVAEKNIERERDRQTIDNRIEAQYRVYKNLMNIARMEELTKNEVLRGLEAMAVEARTEGRREPLVAVAAYDQVSAAFNLQRAAELKQLKDQRFMETMLSVEKSHVPFPDEPGIFFPPLRTWKAITDLRKDKYVSMSLPVDDKGDKDARSVANLLAEPLDMKLFNQAPMTLKEFLGLLTDVFEKKGGKELGILIDVNAFKEADPDAGSPYEVQIQFQPFPKVMTTATALRIALSQIPTQNATYLVRRNYIEVTTNEFMLREKVLKVYPVGDLVIPISQTGGQQNFNFQGGGQFGARGQFGQGGGALGGFGQFGAGGGFAGGGFGGGLGGFGGGLGGFGGGIGGLGGFGGGIGGLGGFGGGINGLGGFGGGFGAPFGGGIGGIGGIGGFGGGIAGQFGNFQGVGGSFNGGAFQGGFNGSLGALGASQAVSLISVITQVVAPGEWFTMKQPNPFQQNIFNPFMMGFGMAGFGGMFGNVGNQFGMMGGNQFGMMGAGPVPTPVSEGGNAPIQQANTVTFFPPSLALIVRGTSRIHTNLTGGIIGGKKRPEEPGARIDDDAKNKGLDRIAPGGKVIIANAGGKTDTKGKNQPKVVPLDPNKAPEDLDPTKVWNEAITKGGVTPGLVVATADFLFEAGQFVHAAEFLKANLRAGIVVRPWVYEALAVALEASGGDADEIRRARLSAVALDPTDAQGFLNAARAMADHKQYDRALAFCRQAALLEPHASQPYADALAYAELGKDSKAMSWAVGKLLSQDWSSDNQVLHETAQKRVQALSQTLRIDKRASEADKLRQILQALRQRDLIINLKWDTGSQPADLEMEVKEPTGTVCSVQQKQTPGGGVFLGTDLVNMTKAAYMAAQAFSGDYEIKVRRLFGQPLGGRATLEIIQNFGTPYESRRLERITLGQPAVVTLQVKKGRRTELASVSPVAPKRQPKEEVSTGASVLVKLRNMAFPDFSGASTPRGFAATPGAQTRAVLPSAAYNSQPAAAAGGVDLTSAAVLQSLVNDRLRMNLPLIPGSGPARD